MEFPKMYNTLTILVLLINLIKSTVSITLNLPFPSFGFDLSHDPNNIRFFLYPSPSKPDVYQELIFLDDNSILQSGFQIGAKTVFSIHGFWSNSSSHFPRTVKNAYLESSNGISSVNYIAVDWGRLGISPLESEELFYTLIYAEVVTENIPIVAKRVADFVRFLEKKSYTNVDLIHFIGHSLGAHISGYAGNLIQKHNGGSKVSRISALDPAGPLFDGVGLQRKLMRRDAHFVDVYHTAMGTRGDVTVDGHADFYPNGGYVQPICVNEFSILNPDPFFLGTCSHSFVVDIFAASISKNLVACKCDTNLLTLLLPFKKCIGNCKTTALAGEPCPSNTRGQYFFKTSNIP